MAGRIRSSDIDEVKSRVQIADVVGEHVQLKSAGIGSLKGLCPFHDEKSPSFHVRPQQGFFHCFGCGESGDAISFLQKHDHLSFTEAVEALAAKVGITLTYEDQGLSEPTGPSKSRLMAANAAAAEFYRTALASPEAEVGRTFLGQRGFDAAAAARFGVGFAPGGWDSLKKHLMSAGYTEQELQVAGLLSQGERGSYDRFRSRLVWPIRDITGQTIGFGARKLLQDDPGPKYLNTPETPVYHKSQVLYGLDLSKRAIAQSNRVVVVEGYTDVMAAHLAGVETAVATCGTAFGADHLRLIKRILPADAGLGEVVFTFDPDAAGQKAAMRAFSEARSVAAQTYIAIGSDGLDPCDLRMTKGDQAVRDMVDQRTPMFEYVLRHHINQYSLDTVEGRVAALRQAASVLADIQDPMMRAQYSHEVAKMLGMDRADVDREVKVALQSGSRPAAASSATQPASSPGTVSQPVVQSVASEASEPAREYRLRDLPNDPSTRLERDALQVILQLSERLEAAEIDRALNVQFQNPALAVIRNAVMTTRGTLGGPEAIERLLTELPEGYATLAREIAVSPIPEANEQLVQPYARGVIAGLVNRELLRQKAELMSQLQRTSPGETEQYRQIQTELMNIEVERRKLQDQA